MPQVNAGVPRQQDRAVRGGPSCQVPAAAAPRPRLPLIRALEAHTAAAWPGLEEARIGTWVLRFGGGYTRRANCVLPFGGGAAELPDKVRFCEMEYAARGLEPMFKMVPEVTPVGLAGVLGERGYERVAPTRVMTCALGRPPDAPAAAARVRPVGRSALVEVYARCAELTARQRCLLARMLARIDAPTLHGVLDQDGSPVACGMAVQGQQWVGIFCVATLAAARRQGRGRQLVRGLLDWAAGQGAEQAYLQVGRGNVPALRLYGGFGFRTVYEYEYCVQPRPGRTGA